MHVVADSFNDAYNKLALGLRDEPEFEAAPRGMKVKETLAASFKIKNPRHRMIFNKARRFKPQYTIAETLWYLSGNNSTEWIGKYAPFWLHISDDGKTANSAYGARIFKPNNTIAGGRFSQWDWIKDELTRDPDSRRAVIHIKSPADSLDAKLDVPCTLTLQFLIRDHKLHMIVNMRSSDLILGIANDVPAFTLFQELLALELGVGLGDYNHTSGSLHVYEKHWGMLDKLCDPKSLLSSAADTEIFGPQPAMPSVPPIGTLMWYETKLAGIDTIAELNDLLTNLKIDEYWANWVRALASYRARELGDLTLTKKLVSAGWHCKLDHTNTQ